MSLKGTLRDFSIPDIFQLVGQQQKDGELFVSSANQVVKILFRTGQIVWVDKTPAPKPERRIEHLVRSELIRKNHKSLLLKTHYDTHLDIMEIVKNQKLVEPQLLERFLDIEAKEILYRIFLLKDGFYEFNPKEVQNRYFGFSPLSCEHAVMEGVRRIDEWPRIQRRIRSSNTRFKKLRSSLETDGGKIESIEDEIDRAFAAFERDNQKESKESIHLDPNERAVFNNITHDRTVRDLVSVCLIGEFETCRALANLLEKNFIAPIRTATAGVQAVDKSEPFRSVYGRFFSASLALGCTCLAFFLIAGIGNRVENRPKPVLSDPASLVEAPEELVRARLVWSNLRFRVPIEPELRPYGELIQLRERLMDHGLDSQAERN